MDSDSIEDKPTSVENVNYGELEAESNNIDSLEVVSSGGDTIRGLGSVAENLTRVELDIACSSEKLINLDILLMHVASRESDFEAFSKEEDHTPEGLIVKALEFDLLYGVLDSEVRVLENFLSALHTEIVSSREVASSFSLLGDTFVEDKLCDCEASLKHSFEQVSDLKQQTADFQRILLASSGDEKWKDNKEIGCLENNNSPDLSAKIKTQTVEQQRNILRMLEKSLAREMDLEKKLTESRETEEELKLRLQQEVFCMEQEAEDMWERLFEAENSAEILSGVSKDLFGRIQMAQFSIKGLIEREGELKSKLEDFSEQNKKLTEKASEAEKIAEIAEAECKKLRMSNMDLNTDVSHLKSSITGATNQVEQLETQSKDSENKRLHAVASAEASQEKQGMLDCKIKDMENLIRDLKSEVLRAENQTESAEDKCIILSESNAELIKEINFLSHRMELFETSLHQADEAKKETAKDISIKGLIEQEGELRSKLEDFSEQNKKLTEKASEAEKIAEIAEAECKKLRMSNMELNTYVSHLKSSITGATNQVEQLETQLKDSENKRLHAVASAEASQEKQSMLDCTIKDMENLIRDLKSKVLRAEGQTESAEEKCIILSESNAELIEDINFLRHRMELFETSLHQADEAKKETAKDIRVRTKLITDLVLQLALERERLHKQISSLIKEKKVAVKFLQRVKDPSVSVIGSPEAKVEVVKLYKNESNNGSPGKESNEEKQGSSATSYEAGNAQRGSPKTGTNTGQDDPSSELDTVRNIDARQLKLKYVLVIVLIFVIPPLAAFVLSQ